MNSYLYKIDETSYNKPVQLAERIWWVGAYLKDDSFQCHPYLIENGDQSILIDPGSNITIKETLRKIEKIIPFKNIRYFICHHQDPDITASLCLIDSMIERKDAMVITHWRAEALLKHYGLKTPFYRIEEHNWKLIAGTRTLRFVYTPYLHFPGAFVTYDVEECILFSSDIFGGLTNNWTLVAQDEGIIDGIRLFHEHYMPSREILNSGLQRIEKLHLKMIAPQHGSIIPHHLIEFVINSLKNIDCGLFLLSERETNIHYLSKVNKLLSDLMETMIIYRDFSDIANALYEITNRMIPLSKLEFYTLTQDGKALLFAPDSRYRGIIMQTPKEYADILGIDMKKWLDLYENVFTKISINEEHLLVSPLFSPEYKVIKSIAVFHLDRDIDINEEITKMLTHINVPLEVALEREFLFRKLDMESKAIYEQSIRDQLTGMFNRIYMHDTIKRVMELHDRGENKGVSLALFDIDHFKSINDTFGHNVGDKVLKKVAGVILEKSRKYDLPVRFGGEEFALFLLAATSEKAFEAAERIRIEVSELDFGEDLNYRKITISAGVSTREQKESLEDFIQRADAKLYKAKDCGRNMVCFV
ncbi:MAG: diguanylate cyclase [Nitrospirae bacterium]|nr:diguanylate cyclase [Nitrospirota bacterium]